MTYAYPEQLRGPQPSTAPTLCPCHVCQTGMLPAQAPQYAPQAYAPQSVDPLVLFGFLTIIVIGGFFFLSMRGKK